MEEAEKHSVKGGPNLALYAVLIYAALLLLGAIGQIFGVGWIQALPIFRTP